MKRKKGWIAKIVVIAVIALLFMGYNLYRYPTMLRSLSDNTLNDAQVEELREEILSQSLIRSGRLKFMRTQTIL